MFSKRPACKTVSPVIAIPDHHCGKMPGFTHEWMVQQVAGLPAAFTLGKSKMAIDNAQWPLRGIDRDQLSSPGLSRILAKRNMVMNEKRPSGQDQVAITAAAIMDIHLKNEVRKTGGTAQQGWLVIASIATSVLSYFLKTYQVRVFPFHNLDDTVQIVPPVQAANPFVDVITEQSHR